MSVKFSELKLNSYLKEGIEQRDLIHCTDIQERSFVPVVMGKDVAGLAQTGTGKTFAFLIPLMERLLRSSDKKKGFKNFSPHHWILILVPTRELGEQVYDQIHLLDRKNRFSSALILGGLSYEKQIKDLKKKPRFVVATPGRLGDLAKDSYVQLSQVRAIVFDEADRLFDMGFQPQVRSILERVPKDRQLLIYSATLNFEVLEMAYEFLAHPIEINISQDHLKAHNVRDCLFHLGMNEKPNYLISILKKYKPSQSIVFTNFKRNVEKLSYFLNTNGFSAQGISSLLNQSQRRRIMDNFKNKKIYSILVATDVAARGLDIKGIDLVINYELPEFSEIYVHRIGRTGRADEKGLAFSFVSDRDVEALQRIEKFLNLSIPVEWLNDGDLVTDLKPFPRSAPSEHIRLHRVSHKTKKPKNLSKRKDRRKIQRIEKKSASKNPYKRKFKTKNKVQEVTFRKKRKSGSVSYKKKFNTKKRRKGDTMKKRFAKNQKKTSFWKRLSSIFKNR